MAERGDQPENAVQGLPRLPPGRHGLTRDFVVKNQRDRLTAGIIAVVAQRGYHETTVSQICTAAGVSRRTFYSYFTSKEECYLHAFDLIGQFLADTLAQAGSEEDDWPARVRARLAALLDVYTANPDLARFTLIAPLRAGEEIAARYQLALDGILRALIEDVGEAKDVRQPSATTEQALVGGMVAMIARSVEEGEGKHLARLLPDLAELILTPYVGRAEAARTARLGGSA